MSAISGFARGLVNGAMLGADMKDKPTRGRGILPEEGPASLDASAERMSAPAAAASPSGDWTLGDPVAEGLSPRQKSFLNAISSVESPGYDVRYTPGGGAKFEGFDKHPGIFEEGPHGPSSAAGRYQFTKSTWDEMGGGSFAPAAQDTRAWELASKRYSAWSGRDLDADLEARGLGADILSALTPTWQGFKNQSKAIKAYNDSLARYSAAPATVAEGAPPAAPAEPKTLVRTLSDNFKANVATARSNLAAVGSPADNWRDLRAIMGG